MKTTISLRVEVEEAEKWKSKAGERTLTEWIREQCNVVANGQAVILVPTQRRVLGREESGESDRVPDVPRDVKVRAAKGRKSEAGGGSFGKPPITLPRAGVCVNCDHPKSKHGGFKGACQAEQCMCGGFE